jgi:hypothetical protein
MQPRRSQLTIRTLMITVMALGVVFALLRDWSDLWPVSVLVVIPLAGLTGLRAQVPPERTSWRFGVSAVMLGLIILGVGWFWARSVIWYIQWQEGFQLIYIASRGEDYQFWGSTVPRNVTGVCLLVYIVLLASACTARRRGLLPVVAAYALALAGSYVILFALLEFEAFD